MTQRAALPVPLRTRIHLCLGEVLHLLYLLLVVVGAVGKGNCKGKGKWKGKRKEQ